MKRIRQFLACSAAALLVLPQGAGAGAKPGKSSDTPISLQGGWCCEGCEVLHSTRGACQKKGGEFFLTAPAAKGKCDSLKGWCCDGGSLFGATRAECEKQKGVFFCDENEAGKKCTGPAKGPAEKGKMTVAPGGGPGKTGAGPALARPPAAGPAKGWCSVTGGLLQLTEDQCAGKKGKFFPAAQKKGALAHSFTITESAGAAAKPGSARKIKARPGAPEGMKKAEPAMKAGPGTFGARIPRVAPEGGLQAAQPGPVMARGTARPVGVGAQASTLAQRIMFFSPRRSDAFNWGDTITVHYVVNLLDEEPGNVTFTFRDPEYREIATTTHYYDAPVLDSFADLESIEPAMGGFVSLEGEPGEDDGPGVFRWTLPERGGSLSGHGFTIAAEKGPHIGVSERFTMISDCSYGNMSISIEPPQEILRQGDSVTVAFSFCGWLGLPEEGPPVYLHHSSSPQSEMDSWTVPSYRIERLSDDRVRGAVRVTIPGDYPRGEGHVISLVYGGGGGIISTHPFVVRSAMGRSDIELSDLFRTSSGDVVARVWVGGSLGGTVLPVRVNERVLTPTVEEGENDIVVGTMTVSGGAPLLGEDPVGVSCVEEWDVDVNAGGIIEESNGTNNRLTRVFSNYENAGMVWLGGAENAYNPTREIACDCFDGTPGQWCDTTVYLRNCSSSSVENIDDLITLIHSGRRLPEGRLEWEDFSEAAAFTVAIGPDVLFESTLPVGDYARIRVNWDDYRAHSDSTLSFSFGYPVSGWAGVSSPFEVNLDFCGP